MIIGIDLGTTNSLAAVWRDGRAQLIPNSLGEYLTPSSVSLSDKDELLIGRAARDRMVTHPERSAEAFKRYMGSDRIVKLGKRSFRPEELSALVLRSLREDAEHFLGEAVDEAIISVPAYFNDTQRKATRLAGELAGLKVDRLINEPTAAALAYGLHHSAGENRFLVFDLGGGTFDVSILELFDGVMEVHASAGDNYLGGEDFVEALVNGFLREHGLKRQELDAREHNILRSQMEAAKRTLNGSAARVHLAHGGRELSWTINQEVYEELTAPLIERLRMPVERALRDAKLRLSDINEVVLVGGSTRKLLVQRMVARMFGRLPLRQINPDEVVALGAAVQAGLCARDAALAEVVLTDVCPYTLGVEITSDQGGRWVEGLFSPIIERNTIIPTSRVETYSPLADFQKQLTLNVYQGEAPFVRDNVFLGELRLPLPHLPKHEALVDVRFTYDVDGILEVEAKVQATQAVHSIIIEQKKGALTQDEIQERLKALQKFKIHPRDEAANQAVLSRAQRLYEEALDTQRAEIGQLITQFMGVLEGQHPGEIHRARVALLEWLDRLDAERTL